MDIVDAQVHMNKVGLQAGLAAMDALGIAAALVHEHDGRDAEGNPLPHHPLDAEVVRPVGHWGEVAARRVPERLAYLWQIDPRDPELDAVVRVVARSPHARALRICAWTPPEVALLAAGGFRPAFAVARAHRLPLFVLVNRCAPDLCRYLTAFPEVSVILDHCGMPRSPDAFPDVLALADYPNLLLKWCHPQRSFPHSGFPYPEWDPLLRAAVDRFGAERMMWASDFTEVLPGCTYAESLFYIRTTPVLTASEREHLLARTARRVLHWPLPGANAVTTAE